MPPVPAPRPLHGAPQDRRRHRGLTTWLLLLGTTTAACSRGEVPVQPAPMADDPACHAARTAFPGDVAGGVEQPVPAEAERAAAAWGNPAVVARCGVNPPAPSTDRCVSVQGVDWVVQELDDGVALVTYGRTPALEVLVPDGLPRSVDLVVPFADAARELPATGRHCS